MSNIDNPISDRHVITQWGVIRLGGLSTLHLQGFPTFASISVRPRNLADGTQKPHWKKSVPFITIPSPHFCRSKSKNFCQPTKPKKITLTSPCTHAERHKVSPPQIKWPSSIEPPLWVPVSETKYSTPCLSERATIERQRKKNLPKKSTVVSPKQLIRLPFPNNNNVPPSCFLFWQLNKVPFLPFD